MADEAKTIPTFGYRKGEAKIFDLKPGEKLPKGWAERPCPGEHPHEIELAKPGPSDAAGG